MSIFDVPLIHRNPVAFKLSLSFISSGKNFPATGSIWRRNEKCPSPLYLIHDFGIFYENGEVLGWQGSALAKKIF